MATNGKTNGAPSVNGRAYPIEDHTYDVVVVGAGGAGPLPLPLPLDLPFDAIGYTPKLILRIA